jgi:FkbM family methyltransferase
VQDFEKGTRCHTIRALNLLRRAIGRLSNALGHNHSIVVFLRPAYDRLLEWSAGNRGLWQRVNDEDFLIDPCHRMHFPETYEPEVWLYLKTHVRPGDVCLNVGAHMGIYALALARWNAPDGQVLAFEPNPHTRAALARHVALNGMADRVDVLAQAVGDAPGQATFFATGREGFSRLGVHNPAALYAESVPVAVTSIDEICAERGLVPDWITLDIEGSEIAALEGARKTLSRGRGRLGIVVEMHPTIWPPDGHKRLTDLLSSFALTAVPLSGQPDPLASYGVVSLEYTQSRVKHV